MNGLDRMLAALNFERPDRVPVFLNNTFSNATLIGESVADVCRSTDLLTRACLEGYRYFGYDGIRVGADVCVEAEAMGCTASFPPNSVPGISHSIVEDEDDFDRLKMPNPYTDGRMPIILEATKRCALEMGDEGYVCSLVMDPVNIASQLMGVNNLLITSIENPEFFERMLEFTTEITLGYAEACVKSGAHGVAMGAAICSASMLGPVIYENYIQDVHTRLIAELNRRGIKYATLHICGQLGNMLTMIADTGVNSLDVDSPVDMTESRAILGKRMAFIGNINTTEMITDTPDMITEKCKKVLSGKEGLGLVLGAGCTMGPATPKENVTALVNAAKEFGAY